MWNVNVVLVAAAINEGFAPNLNILLTRNGDIPCYTLPVGEKSLSYAQSMVKDYLGLTPNWAGCNPTQKGVFEENDQIYIVYYLPLPQIIKQGNSSWVKLDNLPVDDFRYNLIRYAIL